MELFSEKIGQALVRLAFFGRSRYFDLEHSAKRTYDGGFAAAGDDFDRYFHPVARWLDIQAFHGLNIFPDLHTYGKLDIAFDLSGQFALRSDLEIFIMAWNEFTV